MKDEDSVNDRAIDELAETSAKFSEINPPTSMH
jgi:hypothetical protein